jgi:hypothetical protein
MKQLLLFIIGLLFNTNFNAQYKYNISVEAAGIQNRSRNSNNKALYKNDVGLKINYRIKHNTDNYFAISLASTIGNKNFYKIYNATLEYEVGEIIGIARSFFTIGTSFNYFNNSAAKNSLFNFAPTVGAGYYFKIYNNVSLRLHDKLDLLIPNKIGRVFNTISAGVNYGFGYPNKRIASK